MKLNLLYCGLGEMFSEAFQSAEKAKLEIENQSNAIMAMRNFLQKSFWGNLLDNARRSKTSLWVGVQKNRLKNQETRSLVAKSLSNTDANERKLVDLLNNMAKLCNEMSDSKVGKNLAFNNIDYFNELNAEWLLLIDDIMKIIQIT
jgi:ethanolamine utilization protein EutQ (cupin superfamily)